MGSVKIQADQIRARCNTRNEFRVYGHGTPQRVWKAITLEPSRVIYPDTILIVEDHAGNTDEVLAGDVKFDHVY